MHNGFRMCNVITYVVDICCVLPWPLYLEHWICLPTLEGRLHSQHLDLPLILTPQPGTEQVHHGRHKHYRKMFSAELCSAICHWTITEINSKQMNWQFMFPYWHLGKTDPQIFGADILWGLIW